MSSRRAVLTLLLPLAAACAPEPPAGPANLLLVTLDTTRSDHLSVYGYARDTTPRLRGLAETGTRFAQAYAATATTGPSHATLFTSRYPISHGVVKNGVRLRNGEHTLAEHLLARGYATAAFVSSYVLDRRFGWGQGFEHYDDEFTTLGASVEPRHEWRAHPIEHGFDRRADATTRRAIAWLRATRPRGRPFFLFVHYFDPHAPVVPPEPFRTRFAAAPDATRLERRVGLYDGEIAFVDEQIGVLLDALAELDLERSTLVAVTADHGEGLMQHGHMAHGVHLYEEAVRIPLLLRWPHRVPAGRTLESPVGLVDLAPTLIALIGVDAEATDFPGESLAGVVLEGRHLAPKRAVYLQRRHYDAEPRGSRSVVGDLFGIRQDRWKYLESGDGEHRELYDLVLDPGETHDLAREHPEQASRLSARIAAWKDRQPRGVEAPLEIDETSREGLEALGYAE